MIHAEAENSPHCSDVVRDGAPRVRTVLRNDGPLASVAEAEQRRIQWQSKNALESFSLSIS